MISINLQNIFLSFRPVTVKPLFRFTRPDELEFELQNEQDREVFMNLIALLNTVKEVHVENAPSSSSPEHYHYDYLEDYEDEPMDLYYGRPQ